MPHIKALCPECDGENVHLVEGPLADILSIEARCEHCHQLVEQKRLLGSFAVNVFGFTADKLIIASQHTAQAQDAMHEAKTVGVSKTEMEEGYGLMAEREKEKKLDPGTISGKRESRFETSIDGQTKVKEKFTRENIKLRAKEKLRRNKKIS